MSKTFTKAELVGKTAKELKRMCVYELDMPGMTKKSKDEVINAIMRKYGSKAAGITKTATPEKAPLRGVEFSGHSVLTKPTAKFGDRSSTTIQVSCGASSGAFQVAGRAVKEVGEFLREVLNVDKLSTGLVNGKEVSGDYVLVPGDALEFLKPAGQKG